MFWDVVRVLPPNNKADDGTVLSQWTGVALPRGLIPRPGTHYVINDSALSEQRDCVTLPKHRSPGRPVPTRVGTETCIQAVRPTA